MQTQDIKQTITLPCTPLIAFEAWLDSKIHIEIINATAKIDPKVNGKFSLWDGEMTGKTIELNKNKLKIVQEWRDNGSNWPDNYFSTITLEFKAKNDATELIFTQTGIPKENTNDLETGWESFYWKPMKAYFAKKNDK